jgi:hypothetical protein
VPTPSSEAVLYPSPIPMGDPVELNIINPLEYPGWDELVLTNENYSFFHSSSWARVLCESYKYKPIYFTSISNGELSALMPVMEVRSPLTGRRGVSLPFTDYCQPIASDKSHFQEIIDNLVVYGKKAKWKYIEWRGGESYFQDKIHSSFYYGHTLDLTQNEQELLSGFRSSTKRNIKKAIKEGVNIKISNSLESIKAFYRLNCITRKHHGLPPQPYYFFKKIYEHIISKKKGFVVLASFQERAISGAIYFHFRKKAIYKYGASDFSYQHLRPNNLVMWEAIKWCSKNGYRTFDFGRTEPENKGLLQFKQGWGTNENIIKYYKYNFKKASFMSERSKVTGFHNRVFNVTPLTVLKVIGSMLYKHTG